MIKKIKDSLSGSLIHLIKPIITKLNEVIGNVNDINVTINISDNTVTITKDNLVINASLISINGTLDMGAYGIINCGAVGQAAWGLNQDGSFYVGNSNFKVSDTGFVTFLTTSAPSLSNSGECNMYFDGTKLKISENGGVYVNVV